MVQRRFLLHHLPQGIDQKEERLIRQGFISRDSNREIELRQIHNNYSLIISSGDLPSMMKEKIEISEEQFKNLWPLTKGFRIKKRQNTYSDDAQEFMIYHYLGCLSGLVIGTVEFPSLQRARKFTPPTYFKEEITFDYRLSESHLASTKKGEMQNILSVENPGRYQLIGALPYMISQDNLRLMMITTKGSSNWIFPKGQIIKGKINQDVALIEAYEEAGIVGEITDHPLLIPYLKNDEEISMLLYPMRISKKNKIWDESKERERKLVKISKAVTMTNQKGLRSAMGYFDFLKI